MLWPAIAGRSAGPESIVPCGGYGFSELDKAFAACFRLARENGELPASADPQVLAQLASATIHTIAIRARAQVPRKELEAIVKGAIEVMVRV